MKVLLLDDHPLVRSALESVIMSLSEGQASAVEVLTAASAAQAREILAVSAPIDLALLDLQLPDSSGFAMMAEWRRSHPDMPVVIVSASEHPQDVVRALEEGAMGFIPKRTSNEVLTHALRLVLSGGIYVPPMALHLGQVAARLPAANSPAAILSGARHGVQEPSPGDPLIFPTPTPSSMAGRGRVAFAQAPSLRLTPRQSEVLELLLQGQPNKLIARQLNLSVETVKDHVASLLRVLGVSSRTQAVLAVNQLMGMGMAASAGMPLSRSAGAGSAAGI